MLPQSLLMYKNNLHFPFYITLKTLKNWKWEIFTKTILSSNYRNFYHTDTKCLSQDAFKLQNSSIIKSAILLQTLFHETKVMLPLFLLMHKNNLYFPHHITLKTLKNRKVEIFTKEKFLHTEKISTINISIRNTCLKIYLNYKIFYCEECPIIFATNAFSQKKGRKKYILINVFILKD